MLGGNAALKALPTAHGGGAVGCPAFATCAHHPQVEGSWGQEELRIICQLPADCLQRSVEVVGAAVMGILQAQARMRESVW